jgi:hypothetical protein
MNFEMDGLEFVNAWSGLVPVIGVLALSCCGLLVSVLMKQLTARKALRLKEQELGLQTARLLYEQQVRSHDDAVHRREHEEKILQQAESLARVLLQRR